MNRYANNNALEGKCYNYSLALYSNFYSVICMLDYLNEFPLVIFGPLSPRKASSLSAAIKRTEHSLNT